MQSRIEQTLHERVQALIALGVEHPIDEHVFETMVLKLLRWQRAECTALDRALSAAELHRAPTRLSEVVGVPTDVFKSARIATFAKDREIRCFHSSGTTREVRGQHAFATLELYEDAATTAAACWLLPRSKYHCMFFAESEHDAPHSSLSAMLAMFAHRWSAEGQPSPWCIRNKQLDKDAIAEHIQWIRRQGAPVALLGSTFAFVHYADRFEPLRLPAGSVVMPTGGFKGQSRELAPEALLQLLKEHLGVERQQIVQEYGMTELSSQAYEVHSTVNETVLYRAPPWMKMDAVNPEDLSVLPLGIEGILRVIDLANIGSCVAIQTLDLGTVYEHGFTVRGRLPGATPRGCGRAMDALLSGDD